MAIKYYILDTETTGLKAGFHEINQLSVIRMEDGFQRSWHIAVKNPNRASEQALEIQNITKADLRKGIPIEQAVNECTAFLEEDGLNPESRCVIGHNVAFDRRFTHAEWLSCNKRFPCDLWLCTKKYYKSYVNKIGDAKIIELQDSGVDKVKYGQDLCLKGAGLKPKIGAHSATVDSQNCMSLVQFLFDQKLNYVRVIENIPHALITKSKTIESYDYE